MLPISPQSDEGPGLAWPLATGDMGVLTGTKHCQVTPPGDLEHQWDIDWPVEQLPDAGLQPQPKKSRKPASSSGGRVDKRDKYREKNRVAAAKCRAKKKEHIDGLEDNHRTQNMLNALLKQTAQTLRDELSFWRTQALQHGYCECKAIQEYNLKKARALATDTDFGADQMPTTASYSASDDFDTPSTS